MAFDLLLRNATLHDGTGSEPRPASVGVSDGLIAAVGPLEDAEAAEEIDCAGRVLCPGFIDMHSHADWVLPQADHGAVLRPLVEQGITTLVAGNCGFSPAPLVPANAGLVPFLGRLLHDHDLDYTWAGMGEFLGRLEKQGVALNVAQFVGHGALRTAVKGLDPSPATEEEVARMADLAREALDEGAIGISTGLGYAPGVFADVNELVGVTAPLAERGGVYASHARAYFDPPREPDDPTPPMNIQALDETAAVCRAHGIPVQHSHLIFVGHNSWRTTDRALSHLEELVEDGVDIACDAFPYVGGNTTLVVFMPAFTLPKLADVVADPAQRRPVAEILNRVQALLGMRWEDTQILWVPDAAHRDYEGRSVADIARDRGRDGTETYLDLIGELGPQTRIMNWNYSGRDDEEESLRKVLAFSRTCFETDTILTGNGVDNPASYGTFPRILGRYVRELRLVTLPEAIRRMTSWSAERMGLRDRGRVAQGLAADLVIFDPERVGDETSRSDPQRSPTGIDTVLMNGVPVVREGRFDARRSAGRVLRLS
ncbi:MAG: D-aminoacylase [Myxococcota bacterium]|nr:D-aminoacylase [Myxococcota bacterium]